MFLVLFPSSKHDVNPHEKLRSSAIGTTMVVIVLGQLILFSAIYISSKFNLSFDFLTPISLVFIYIISLLFSRKIILKIIKKDNEYLSSKNLKKLKIRYLYLYPIFIFVYFLSFSIFWDLNMHWMNTSQMNDNFWSYYKFVGCMLILSVISSLPGVYFAENIQKKERQYLLREGAAITIFSIIIFSIIAKSFLPVIIDRAMSFSGISDFTTRDYMINGTTFPMKRFESSLWNTTPSEIKDKFIVSGVMVYSFNGVKLLCPTSILKPYSDMKHYIPFDSNYDKESMSNLLKESGKCQSFINGGVVRLSNIKNRN